MSPRITRIYSNCTNLFELHELETTDFTDLHRFFLFTTEDTEILLEIILFFSACPELDTGFRLTLFPEFYE